MNTIQISDMSPQQVFDHIVTGIVAQGGPGALPDGRCAYRTPDGKACAAGQLMGDEEVARLEDQNTHWGGLVERGRVPKAHLELIQSLQGAHDVLSVKPNFLLLFLAEAHRIARRHHLRLDRINAILEGSLDKAIDNARSLK